MDMIKPIAALLATCLACTLYGAGLRRPFGSVPRIPDVPVWLWSARRRVQVADCLFLLFTLAMLFSLWRQMNFIAFLVLGSIFYFAGELLTYKVRLMPAFFISVALAIFAITLTIPQSAIGLATAAAE
jgi:hypothetical protein